MLLGSNEQRPLVVLCSHRHYTCPKPDRTRRTARVCRLAPALMMQMLMRWPAKSTCIKIAGMTVFEGPGASNAPKIPRKDPPRERRKKENCGDESEKSAIFWALHPSGAHPSGPHPSGRHPSVGPPLGPHFFWVWAPRFWVSRLRSPDR